jgi:hypothetical protein
VVGENLLSFLNLNISRKFTYILKETQQLRIPKFNEPDHMEVSLHLYCLNLRESDPLSKPPASAVKCVFQIWVKKQWWSTVQVKLNGKIIIKEIELGTTRTLRNFTIQELKPWRKEI